MSSARPALGRLSAERRTLGGGSKGKVSSWRGGGCVRRCLQARRGSAGCREAGGGSRQSPARPGRRSDLYRVPGSSHRWGFGGPPRSPPASLRRRRLRSAAGTGAPLCRLRRGPLPTLKLEPRAPAALWLRGRAASPGEGASLGPGRGGLSSSPCGEPAGEERAVLSLPVRREAADSVSRRAEPGGAGEVTVSCLPWAGES